MAKSGIPTDYSEGIRFMEEMAKNPTPFFFIGNRYFVDIQFVSD